MRRDPWLKIFPYVFVACLFVCARPSFASTLTVSSTADSGPNTLRDAIANAANGDTINFNLSYPATIAVTTPLTFGPSVTVTGPGSTLLTISGGNSVVDFVVNAGAVVGISGMTITQGSSLLGGGIFNAGTLTLTNCEVKGNGGSGTQFGGGIFNSGTLTVTGGDVNLNNANDPGEQDFGGGIYNSMGTVTLTKTAVSFNNIVGGKGDAGGGIYNDNGVVTMTQTTVTTNTSDTGGAGIYNNSPSPTGAGGGGGIFVIVESAPAGGAAPAPGTFTIDSSLIWGNFCGANLGCVGGGGIYNKNGVLNITNSTVFDNHADSPSGTDADTVGGAGILNDEGTLTVTSSTVDGNFLDFTAGATGVEINNFEGTMTVKNSLLGHSDFGGNCAAESATSSSGGHNLSDDNSCATFFNQLGDMNNTPTGLSPAGLNNNGGPTLTLALLPASAAVNAVPVVPTSYCTDANGNPLTKDQRGVRRPVGSGCDIGAFEYFQSILPIPAVQTYVLMSSVQSVPAPSAGLQGLIAPLQSALNAMNAGLVNPATAQLEAFINLATHSSLLTPTQSAPLIGSAQQIIQTLRP